MDLTAFHALVDALPDPLLLLDEDGTVLAAGRAVEGLLPALSGCEDARLDELVQDDPSRVAHMLRTCLENGGALPGALTPRPTQGGAVERVRCTLARLPANDGGGRILVRLEPRAPGLRPRALHHPGGEGSDDRPGRRPHEEQGALHRVASAVAASVPPEALFDLVAEEVAGLLGAEAGIVWRFEGVTSLAVGSFGDHLTVVGSRFPLRGAGVLPRVWSTGRAARAVYDQIPADDPTRERVVTQGYREGVGAPVRAAGRVWGAVLAATTRENGLPDGAEERLESFADLVGLAITNSDDRRALAERAAEQSALGRVATAVAAERPPEEIFDLVCREATRITGAAAGMVAEVTGPAHSVIRASWIDRGAPSMPLGTILPLDDGAIAWLAQGASPARRTSPSAGSPIEGRGNWGDAVTAAIMIGGGTWGTLSVVASRDETLPIVVERRLTGFAELAGVAVANAAGRRETTRRATEQAALRRVATAIAADVEPQALLDMVSSEAAELLGAATALVIEIDDRGVMRVVASWQRAGLPGPPAGLSLAMPPGDDERARALREGRPVRVPRGVVDPGAWRAAYGDEFVVSPVGLRGRVWGMLCVGPEQGLAMEPETEERLLAFSRLVGVAILNAETRAALQNEAREQAALRRVATAVAAEADLDEVFALICREAAALLGVPSAGVMRLLDDHRSQVVANWTAEGLPAPERGLVMEMEERPDAARDLVARRIVHYQPDPAVPGWTQAFQDIVAAPIILGDDLWGTLGIGSVEGPLWSAIEARLADFADLAGIAVTNDETRRRSVDEAATLIAGGALDMESTLEAIARSTRRALFADRITCIVADADGRAQKVHTTEADPDAKAQLERAIRESPLAAVMLRRATHGEDPITETVDVRATMERLAGEAVPLAMASTISIRLEFKGEVLGVIVAAYRIARRFTPRDRAALRSLASVAELALANARLHALTLGHLADAEERAATDPLTGLANHRAFHERLKSEIERAQRHRRPLSLAVFDLDHFKEVNDRHGHQVGDQILVEVARRIAAQARPEDLVARLGGEEFAWLLPESDSLDGWQAAERARETVRATPFTRDERCTLSGGVAELAQARDAGDLLRLADGALYWAKGHGRDVCFRYSPDVVSELSAQERADRLERSQALNAIRVLARAVDAKDPSTRRHSERVAELADLIAGELGWDPERRSLLRGAGLVHDVGKIGVPDIILFKPDRLSLEEYGLVKQHALLGAQIVADALASEQVSWVRWHHERVDGTGYPDGLAGDDIPAGARILSVADAWDVMIGERPYAPPVSVETALAECRRAAGSQFCPVTVAALERLVSAGAAATREAARRG